MSGVSLHPVISNMLGIAVAYVNDILMTYWLPLRPIVKDELDLHKLLSFVWHETHSVDTARWALYWPL